MTSQPKTVHVPYTLQQDEDGIWCAHAWLGSSGGANGSGATPDEAVADLREAVEMVIEEDGVPEQLARTLDLEVALHAASCYIRCTADQGAQHLVTHTYTAAETRLVKDPAKRRATCHSITRIAAWRYCTLPILHPWVFAEPAYAVACR